jgi:hypothetical protein
MDERSGMYKAGLWLSAIVLIGFILTAPNVSAMNIQSETQHATDFSAQVRERSRVRVRPVEPPAYDYPRPGDYSWPGPGAVRHCVDWYALEHRPSGTVLTPQMRCRWVRG